MSACIARILVAYDGSDFHGWQIQPGLRTVQGEILRCLERLLPRAELPPGAGRTDAGVHARGQVCSVVLEDDELLSRLQRGLGRMVPEDIAILSVQRASPDFHARFSARGRRYCYRMSRRRDPLRRRDHLLIRGTLDLEAMERACEDLRGDHDYSSFCRSISLEPGRSRCVVQQCRLVADDETGILCFEILADRFLHSMVRSIVGTLLEIGRGQRPPDSIPQILAAQRRAAAGATAPAHGLCLEEVLYGEPPSASAAASR